MYSPLALTIAGVVLGGFNLARRKATCPLWFAPPAGLRPSRVRAHANATAEYRSARALWSDTAAKRPGNACGHDWLAHAALGAAARSDAEALAEFPPRSSRDSSRQSEISNKPSGPHLGDEGNYASGASQNSTRRHPGSGVRRRPENLGRAETQLAMAVIQGGTREERYALRRAGLMARKLKTDDKIDAL